MHASLAGVRRVSDKRREKVASAERRSFAIFHCDLGSTPAQRSPSLRLWWSRRRVFSLFFFTPLRGPVPSSHLGRKMSWACQSALAGHLESAACDCVGRTLCASHFVVQRKRLKKWWSFSDPACVCERKKREREREWNTISHMIRKRN